MTPTMHRTTSFLSLTLLMTAAWAEDAAPVPVPAADAPAPAAAPVAAPVAAPAADVAPAPAAPSPATANEGVKADDVVFTTPQRRVRPANAPITKPYSFGVNLSAGYDSNILLENSDTPTATNAKGMAYTAEVRGNYRLVDNARGRLGVFGSAEFDGYPGNSAANLSRLGGGFTAGTSAGGFDPGVVVGYNRFSIDNTTAARAINVNAYVAKVFESNVSVLGIGSQYVDYADNDPISGTLYDVSYRHWFLFEPKRISRRVELAIKAGKNRTHSKEEGYTILTPTIGALYRFGDKPVAGTQDLSGKIQYELRQYPEPSAGGDGEKQKLLSITAGYDYWLAEWISAGLYAGYSKRSSTDEANRYDRKQGGVRLTATW